MINRLCSWLSIFLGFKSQKTEPPQLIHFVPDTEHKPIEFMTIEEAIQSGIDVEKDEEKYGMTPLYYRNGKPEFIYDLIADPGLEIHIIPDSEVK